MKGVKFLSKDYMQQKFHIQVDITKYNGLISAIPRKWYERIRNAPLDI